MKPVICSAHANSALRASLVQEPAWSGPVWLGSCPISPRFSSLKIAPGGTLHSAAKGAPGNSTPAVWFWAAISLVVRKQRMSGYWLRLEMPSEAKIQGRSGGMPDRGRPAQDVL